MSTEVPLDEFFLRREEQPSMGAAARSEAVSELLLFALGHEELAVEVTALREIVMPPPLSDVPRARPGVLGVTMLRGRVVPVFDPRPALRLSARDPTAPHARVIIADSGQGPFGLWVDRVLHVLRVKTSSLETPPAALGGETGLLTGVGRHGTKVFGVVNLAKLVAPGGRA